MYPEASVIGLSILFQLAAAILSLRLIRITGKKLAWFLVSAAIALMTVRRVESLLFILADEPSRRPDMVFEITGLFVSALMLAGITLIKPIFSAYAQSEESLRAMNARLTNLSDEQHLLLEHTKDFIYRHDPQGIITYVSPAVEKITGYSQQEWLAHYTTHYTGHPANKAGLAVTDEMLRTGAPGPSYIVEVRHKSGGKVWLEVNKQPYRRDGQVAGIIGVARDITKRMSLEQEREKLTADLQDAVKNIKTLRGLLPICASCKKIRDDSGYWNQIEAYVSKHSEAEFTHSLCPVCIKKLYPEYDVDKK